MHDCYTTAKTFLVYLVKSLPHQKLFKVFLQFFKPFTACELVVLLIQQVIVLLSGLACVQSPGWKETLKNSACFGFIMDISILYFKACLHLIKVSTDYLYFLEEACL